MSASIEAVKSELEAARQALLEAEEEYAKDAQAERTDENRLARSYEWRARNSRNVDRLEKVLALLEEADDDR